MHSSTKRTAGNPVDVSDAPLEDGQAKLPELVANLLKRSLLALVRDPEVRAALNNLREEPAAPSVHMTRGEYARSRRISGASVSRLVAAGMPVVPLGTTDRIDPVAADEWRRSRERKPTTQSKSSTDDVDVTDALGRAGLRAAGAR
jgi:hypothetical protein